MRFASDTGSRPQTTGVVLFHPVTSEADSMGAQAQALFGALAETGKTFVTIFPNNDPGVRGDP